MFGQYEFQKAFVELNARLAYSVERMSNAFVDMVINSKQPMKALTVFLYAWSAFAAALTLATVINILMVIF